MMCLQDTCGAAAGSSTFQAANDKLRICTEESSMLLSRGANVVSGKQHGTNGAECASDDGADGGFLSLDVPSRHLLVSNLTWAADQTALEQLFTVYGPVEGIQVFQDKGCAVVIFSSIKHAEAAKESLAGLQVNQLTGGRLLEIYYLHPHPPTATVTTRTNAPVSATASRPSQRAQLPPAWPGVAVPPRVRYDDDGSTSSRISRTSTTSSRPESDDAATLETWRTVRRQGSSATSTSLDTSDGLDSADLMYAGSLGAGGVGVGAAGIGLCVPHASPSAALWLSNLEHGDRYDIEALLSPFGPLDGVLFFPERGIAFASFLSAEDAAAAKAALDGQLAPALAGAKPLRVDLQTPQDVQTLCSAPGALLISTGLPSPADAVQGASGLPRTNSGSSRSRSASADSTATTTAVAPAAAPAASVPPAPAAPAAADVPSRHLWLGNILQNVDRQAVELTFSRFGPLESTRVFPVKHFAFVTFLSIEHAVAARAALRGQAVPSLSGSRNLEVRFQHRRPLGCQAVQLLQQHQQTQIALARTQAAHLQTQLALATAAAAAAGAGAGRTCDGGQGETVGCDPHSAAVAVATSERRSSGGGSAAGGVAAAALPAAAAATGSGVASGFGSCGSSYDLEPSRHLWLGNVLSSAKQQDLESVLSRFGPVESVRIFPAKNYAFVNFKSPQSAEAAKLALGGRPVPSITGSSPLLLRYKRLPADSSNLGRQP